MAAKSQDTRVLNYNVSVIQEELRNPRFCSELRLELKSENPETWGVWYRFHHGVSFSSYGEKITISLTVIDQGSTKVDILSECGMPTQIFDWGKNKSNISAIFNYLGKYLRPSAPATSQPNATLLSQFNASPAPQSNVTSMPQSEPVQSNISVQQAPSKLRGTLSSSLKEGQPSAPCRCMNCGGELLPAHVFCPTCGNKI